MVPLAIGTQTNGSVIRPASFCGIVGYKPTFGLIPRTGVLMQCRPLDTVGVFARTVADAAMLADALVGFDGGDPDTHLMPPPRLLDVALSEPPVRPALAFVKGPYWDKAEPESKDAFAELTAALGEASDEMALPDAFAESLAAMHTINHVGLARHYRTYYERGGDQLSDAMRGAIEKGREIAAVDYLAALDRREVLRAGLELVFDSCDAIVTPAATGEALIGLDWTGDPSFCTIWSLCGVPAISLPLLQGPNGLPVGVQLVGRSGEDARLLRTARWVVAGLVGETAAEQEVV
jgi:Asp-tRNA(Asn)/Glu-tRNA(Gln) amidotransferase A subunit family amidase